MPTWSVARIENALVPTGEAYYLLLSVTSLPLGFVPAASHITIERTKIGPLVGWRTRNDSTNALGRLLWYQDSDGNEAPLVETVKVVPCERTSESDAAVRVFVRLKPSAYVGLGAYSRPIASSGTRASLYVARVDAGFVTLRDSAGSSTVVVSDAVTYVVTDPDPSPPNEILRSAGLNLGPAARVVGAIPGFDYYCLTKQTKPELQFYADSQHERCVTSPTGTFPVPVSVSELHDNRLDPANAIGVPGRLGELILAGIATLEQRYPAVSLVNSGASFKVYEADDPPYSITPNASTFGCVFRFPTSPQTTTVQTIMGRITGDNATCEWRLLWNKNPSTPQMWAQFLDAAGGDVFRQTVVDIETPTTNTSVVYRGGATKAEFWINGELKVSQTPVAGGNPDAIGPFTVGARDSASGWIEPFVGYLEQAFVYSETLSDSQLALVIYESCYRASIPIGGSIKPEWQTQPYNGDNPNPERRLDRKPIAVVSLFADAQTDTSLADVTTNLMGQRYEWFGGTVASRTEHIISDVSACLNGCDDFEIMFNRPAGQYLDDIIPSGIFGTMSTYTLNGAITDLATPIISPDQWQAMRDAWDILGLNSYNDREGVSFFSANYARRAWFYTGGGLCLDIDGNLLDNGRMSLRICPPLHSAQYKEAVLDKWIDETAGRDDRFRCLMLDSMAQGHAVTRFAEILHPPGSTSAGDSIPQNFTLVGEAISVDAAARLSMPLFGMSGFPSAPWWNVNESGWPQRTRGYNRNWAASFDPETMVWYFGLTRSEELDLTATGGTGSVTGEDNMRFGDIYRFILNGAIPVAWIANYSKVGAAWDYATGRIPVGRQPMLSPRISRIWR